MNYLSYIFTLCFLPITLCVYWIFKKSIKIQNIVLLLASIIFYAFFELKYTIALICCICLTFFGALLGSRVGKNNEKIGKTIYISTLVINLLILVVFKYANFVVSSFYQLFGGENKQFFKLLLPIGLSFYIFQSSSYLFDLISKKVEVEKNFITFALFVSFFPTITAGPIQKSDVLLPKLKEQRSLTFAQFKQATYIFLWGAFLKLVIADRLSIFTNEVFLNFNKYGGFELLVSAVFYSIQIYADFSGYSFMSIAIALFLGFKLEDNFKQPYFATTVADFWKRWHISLTSWFRNYLYIPLGGNRKGKLRKYVNVFIVFLVSGLWHGAAWSFVLWGGIHALYQTVGALTQNVRSNIAKALNVNTECASFRIWKRFCVFVLVMIAWIFFKMNDVGDAFKYIWRMISIWNPWVLVDKSLYNHGLTQFDFKICFIAVAILFVVSFFKEKGKSSADIVAQNVFASNVGYFLLVFAIVVFGIYGANYTAESFIYMRF